MSANGELKNRDRLADCAEIERMLPGWTAKFLSHPLLYAARSPDYDEKTGRGHFVIGVTPESVIARVRRGQRLHAKVPAGTIASATPREEPVAEDLPRESTAEENNNPISNRAIALRAGYTGDPCAHCGAWTLLRNETCLKCDSCGETSGCS